MPPTPTTPPPAVPRPSGRKILLILLGVLRVAVALAVALPNLAFPPPPPELDDRGVVPSVALVDQSGKPMSTGDMRGQITIVGFIFTRCDSVCPTVGMRMSRMQDLTADVGDRVKLLAISVDPAYDTPDKLKAWGDKFHAEPARWRLATGDPAAVRSLVMQTFTMSMTPNGTTPSGAPDIVHTQHFILVDGDLRIRGSYDSSDDARFDAIGRHARWLANRLPR
jgi:protein SCO1/2